LGAIIGHTLGSPLFWVLSLVAFAVSYRLAAPSGPFAFSGTASAVFKCLLGSSYGKEWTEHPTRANSPIGFSPSLLLAWGPFPLSCVVKAGQVLRGHFRAGTITIGIVALSTICYIVSAKLFPPNDRPLVFPAALFSVRSVIYSPPVKEKNRGLTGGHQVSLAQTAGRRRRG
jgi:hypothetical protein